VIEAKNGRKALTIIRNHDRNQIDLIITDVIIPEMSGKTLTTHYSVVFIMFK